MATIKLSLGNPPPAGNTITLPNGQSAKEWFGFNYSQPNFENFETEKSVAFDAEDLDKITKQAGCAQLVLSKKIQDNKKTLAIAGVDGAAKLQDGVGSLVLVGNNFDAPKSDKAFNLDFSKMLSDAEHQGSWGVPDPISNPTGTFETQMGNFQKTPYQSNLFLTVNFTKTGINGLLTLNPAKIVFIRGYVYYLSKPETLNQDGITLNMKSITPIEVLIAVAVGSDNVVMGAPVTPLFPWPYKWPSYS